ncbi:MAG: type II secretion system F family protein, partial [Candidatus Eremiobacteraeota bacterium]|nr:type II secretion system F family protein [Candidatus Eremiobacteraeota bacterium]
GRMAESLNHCADLMEGEADLKGKVGAALVYPAFITVLFMLAGVLIAFLVLPRFAEILAGFDRQLPLPALLLLKFVQVAFQPWVFLVGLEASLLGWFLLRAWFRAAAGREFVDRSLNSIPLVRNLMEKIWMARLSYTLAALVESGVGLMDALKSSKSSMDSPTLEASLDKVVGFVSNGMEMSNAFYVEAFPPTFVQLLAVGEETGQVVPLLERLQALYEQEVELAVAMFLNLLEPILLGVMGFGVGAFLLTLMLPMLSLFGAVSI